MAKQRLDNLPAEILVEICRNLVHPMQSKPHGHGPNMKPQTDDALTCRATLARLMRTCRNLHDAAGCVLYSGYYQLWHPSDAYQFLKTLDPHRNEPCYDSSYARHLSPDDTRRQLVRHVDLHGNVDRRTLSAVPWTKRQMTRAKGARVEEMASALGMPFPKGWNESRLAGETDPGDHAAEHINQLLLRYLSDLTSLKMTLVFNWTFDVLGKWIEEWVAEQPGEHASPFRNLRHLRLHLRSVEARSFNCLKLIVNNAPYLSTLEIYDTASYRPPQGSRLEALRSLTFVQSSMDRGTMKATLQAVPNITHFEYHHSTKNLVVDKQPPLTPQMLCHLLSNEYELAMPPPLNKKGQLVKAALPDLHRRLRTLILDFPVFEGTKPWGDQETVLSLQHFMKLRYLSIDTSSIAREGRGKKDRTFNSLETIIPESLEHLEITRVGGSLQELVRTSLPNLSKALSEGRFQRLERISLTGCPGPKGAAVKVQSLLQNTFGAHRKPTIWVTGHTG